jgi:hypothetical protein
MRKSRAGGRYSWVATPNTADRIEIEPAMTARFPAAEIAFLDLADHAKDRAVAKIADRTQHFAAMLEQDSRLFQALIRKVRRDAGVNAFFDETLGILKSGSFCLCGQPENSHTAGILPIGDEFRERIIFRGIEEIIGKRPP